MADEYTPTTGEVRRGYIDTLYALGGAMVGAGQFDRWLAQHDAEVAARALRDAADAWHVENRGTSPRAHQWLWDRADYIEKGADHDPR